MGTTNEIKDIIQKHELALRTCALCQQNFTSEQLEENNWLLHYRTNNDTGWTNFKKRESRGWISLEIQLEHEECPE